MQNTSPEQLEASQSVDTAGKTPHPNSLRRYLDPVFLPLGFEFNSDSLANAAYIGNIEGSRVEVLCTIRTRHEFTGVGNMSVKRYAGLVLGLTVDSPLMTRLSVVRRGSKISRWLANLMNSLTGSRGLRDLPPVYDELGVWAHDCNWARDFLEDQRVVSLVRKIFSDIETAACVAFAIAPKKLNLTLQPELSDITLDAGRDWLATAVELHAVALQKAEPKPIELNWIERIAEDDRKKATFIVAGLMLGVPLALLMLFGAVLLIAGPAYGVVFLLFFMPVAMYLGVRKWLATGRRRLAKIKKALND